MAEIAKNKQTAEISEWKEATVAYTRAYEILNTSKKCSHSKHLDHSQLWHNSQSGTSSLASQPISAASSRLNDGNMVSSAQLLVSAILTTSFCSHP